MKFGMRTPNINKRISARTTGKITRTINKAVNPLYGKKEMGFIVMSGLATGVSWMCYYRALQEGPASVIVPIAKLSILITIAFSWIVFHEKLTKKAAIGLGGIVAGTFLLAIL